MSLPSKTLGRVDCRNGAPMGRRGWHEGDSDIPRRFYLRRVRLDSGGYDSGGAYWGHGAPLYWYYSTGGSVDAFMRGANRDDVKARIRAVYPAASFFR